jgi:muconate cycloisomerase
LNFEQTVSPSEALTPLFIEADRQRKNGAFAGIDVAIHDLWARSFKVSAKNLMGDSPLSPKATAPVGIKMPIAVVGRFFKSMGFEEFKLKVGDNADEDRLLSLRKLVGDSVDLRVDANEHWDADGALQKLATFAKAGITSCEQPVPGRDYEAMGRVAKEGAIQIMADESICTLEDARTLIECGGAKIWNLRLAKIGGFTGMRHFVELGDQHNIEYQLGVLVGESSLLSAASRACFGLTQFRHVEFGFPGILLGADPFKGISLPDKGHLKPLGEAPSFGVEPTKYFEKFRLGTTSFGI